MYTTLIFIGIFISFAIYHFFIFLGRKHDLSNIAYAVFCLFLLAGIFVRYVYPALPFYNELVMEAGYPVIAVLTGIGFAFLTYSIFNLYKLKKFIISYVIIMSAVSVLCTLLYIFFRNRLFLHLIYACLSMYLLVFTVLIYKCIIKEKQYRDRMKRIVIIGYSILIIIFLIYFGAFAFGITFPHIYNRIGYLILAMTIAYALTSNFNKEHRDLKELKAQLEQKIKERTEELVDANKRLKELDKAKTDYFAFMSHEFRTPLTSIQSPLEAIIHGKFGDSISRKSNMFTIMYGNCQRLIRLIDKLFLIIKIEQNKIELHKKKINISQFLEKKSFEMREIAGKKNISLRFYNKTEKDIVAFLDDELLETALFCLLDNAIKYTPQDGSVIVQLSVRNKENEFCITIEDTGIGIPEDRINIIFNKFQRVAASIEDRFNSGGVGLYIVKNIVCLHHGNISVKSKEGKGSSFLMRFPLNGIRNSAAKREISIKSNAAQNDLISPERKNDYPDNKKKTILILEDDADMQEILSSILDPHYNIILCFNGKEGLKILELTRKPDLIIADVMMPVMNGREFYGHVKADKNLSHIPVIFVTARAIDEEKIKSLAEGAVDYIYKPFRFDEILYKVGNFLKREDTLLDRMKEKVLHALDNDHQDTGEPVLSRHRFEKYKITGREREIVLLLKQGLQYKEIADKLDVSMSTIKTHMQNIYKKTDTQNKVELLNELFL